MEYMENENTEERLEEKKKLLQKVKQMYEAPIKINAKYVMPKIDLVDSKEPKEFRCVCCGKTYTRQTTNFYKAGHSILWKGNNGYLPFCKSCCETIYRILVDIYQGNKEHALRHWCSIFDYPYDFEAAAMSINPSCNENCRIGTYLSKINTRQIQSRASTFIETLQREGKDDCYKNEIKELLERGTIDDGQGFKLTKSIIKKWGYGYDEDEYEWLEEQEADWRSRVECITKPQEELIINLCLSQLNIRSVQKKGGRVADAMKAFQDILATCNLQPRQNTNDDTSEQSTFGTFIKKIEDEEPIPEADEEWKDVDRIKEYIDTFFLGHLSKLVHIENDNSIAYEREMEKYTVKPIEYENDDESNMDFSILDKYSDKRDKDDVDE